MMDYLQLPYQHKSQPPLPLLHQHQSQQSINQLLIITKVTLPRMPNSTRILHHLSRILLKIGLEKHIKAQRMLKKIQKKRKTSEPCTKMGYKMKLEKQRKVLKMLKKILQMLKCFRKELRLGIKFIPSKIKLVIIRIKQQATQLLILFITRHIRPQNLRIQAQQNTQHIILPKLQIRFIMLNILQAMTQVKTRQNTQR